MILPIFVHDSKVLREKAKSVIVDRKEYDAFISDMIETLKAIPTGIGLAAPQVGKSIKIFIMWANRVDGQPSVFINPEIIETKGAKKNDYEGCLSVPNIHIQVERFQKIRVKYLDNDWNEKTELFKNFEARIIQHEYDHLEGVEFFDRLSKIELAKIQYKLNRIAEHLPDVPYPITRD